MLHGAPLTICWLLKVSMLAQVAELATVDSHGADPTDSTVQCISAGRLAVLNAKWDSRDSITEQLRAQTDALQAHTTSLAAQANDLCSPTSASVTSGRQSVKSAVQLQSVAADFVTVLHQIADASQCLPSSSNESALSYTLAWKSTAFVVKTVQAVLSSCFSSATLDDMHTSSPRGSSLVKQTLGALEASLKNWNQSTLVPFLGSQLQESASNLASSEPQQTEDMPNGNDSDLLQDLSALELAPMPSIWPNASPVKGKGSPLEPELVPFDDFDTALEGGDQLLESGLEDSELQQSTATPLELDLNAQSDRSSHSAPDRQGDSTVQGLVPFHDFDSLAGAHESLEAAADDDQGDALEYTDMLSHSEPPGSSSPPSAAEAEAEAVSSSPGQRLSEAMTQYVLSAGAVATAEQLQAAAETARAEAHKTIESGALDQQLVALEWEHEAELEEALQLQGGLGQPVLITPKVRLNGCLHLI